MATYPSRQSIENWMNKTGRVGDPYRAFDAAFSERIAAAESRGIYVDRVRELEIFDQKYGGYHAPRTAADMPASEVYARSAGDQAQSRAVGAIRALQSGRTLHDLDAASADTLDRLAGGAPANSLSFDPTHQDTNLIPDAIAAGQRAYTGYKDRLDAQAKAGGPGAAEAADELQAIQGIEQIGSAAIRLLDKGSRGVLAGVSQLDRKHAISISAAMVNGDPSREIPFIDLLDAATYGVFPNKWVDAKFGPNSAEIARLADSGDAASLAKLGIYGLTSAFGIDPSAGGYPVKALGHAAGFLFGDPFFALGAGRKSVMLGKAIAENPKLFASIFKYPRLIRDMETAARRVSWVQRSMRSVDEIKPEILEKMRQRYGPEAIELARELGPALAEKAQTNPDVANGLLSLSMAEFADSWMRRPSFSTKDFDFLVESQLMRDEANTASKGVKDAGKQAGTDPGLIRAQAARARWNAYVDALVDSPRRKTAALRGIDQVIAETVGKGIPSHQSMLALEFVARELMGPDYRYATIFDTAEAAAARKTAAQATVSGSAPGSSASATPAPASAGPAVPQAQPKEPAPAPSAAKPLSPQDEFAAWTQTPDGKRAMQQGMARAQKVLSGQDPNFFEPVRDVPAGAHDDDLFHQALQLQEEKGIDWPDALMLAHARRDILPTYGPSPFGPAKEGPPPSTPMRVYEGGKAGVRSYETAKPTEEMIAEARSIMEQEGLDYPDALKRVIAKEQLLPPAEAPAEAARPAAAAPPPDATTVVVPEAPEPVPQADQATKPVRRLLDIGGEVQSHELAPEQVAKAKEIHAWYQDQIEAAKQIKQTDPQRANLIAKNAREKLWATNREIVGAPPAEVKAPAGKAPAAPAAPIAGKDYPEHWGPGFVKAKGGESLPGAEYDLKFEGTTIWYRKKERPGFATPEDVNRSKATVQQAKETALAPVAQPTVDLPPYRIAPIPGDEAGSIAGRFLPEQWARVLTPTHVISFGDNKLYQFTFGGGALFLDQHGLAYVNEGGRFRATSFAEAVGGVNEQLRARGMAEIDPSQPMILAKRQEVIDRQQPRSPAPGPGSSRPTTQPGLGAATPQAGAAAAAGTEPPAGRTPAPSVPARPLAAVLDDLEGSLGPEIISAQTKNEAIKLSAIKSVFKVLRGTPGSDYERLAAAEEYIRSRARVEVVKVDKSGFANAAADVLHEIKAKYFPVPEPRPAALLPSPQAMRQAMRPYTPPENLSAYGPPAGARLVAEWRPLEDEVIKAVVQTSVTPDREVRRAALARGVGPGRAARLAYHAAKNTPGAPLEQKLRLAPQLLDKKLFEGTGIRQVGFYRNLRVDPATGKNVGQWRLDYIRLDDRSYVKPSEEGKHVSWRDLEQFGIYVPDKHNLVLQRYDGGSSTAEAIAGSKAAISQIDQADQAAREAAKEAEKPEIAPQIPQASFDKTFHGKPGEHRELVKQAMEQGRATSHPDHPGLAPSVTADPAGGPMFSLPGSVLNRSGAASDVASFPQNVGSQVGMWRGLSEEAFYDVLAGKAPRAQGIRAVKEVLSDSAPGELVQIARQTGKKTSPGYLVRTGPDGGLLEAWRWNPKTQTYEGADLRKLIYTDKINRGVAVDPKSVADYPELMERIERARTIRQVKAMVDRGAVQAPAREVADPELVRRMEAGDRWQITEREIRSLDGEGGVPPSTEVAALPPGSVLGRNTAIGIYGMDDRAGRYAVIDRTHLVTSHSADGVPQREFPLAIQPRTDVDGTHRLDVQTLKRNQEYAEPGKYNPYYVVTDNPASDNGPSVVYALGDGRFMVVGGNQRILLQDMQVKNGNFGVMRDAIIDRAGTFGFSAEDIGRIRGMQQPTLVRVISEPVATWGEMVDLGRALNRTGQDGISAAQRAASDAQALRPLFEKMRVPQGMTFSQALKLPENGPHILEVWGSLDNDAKRAFFQLERDAEGNIQTANLTAAGLERMGRAVLSNLVSSPEIAEIASRNSNVVDGLLSSFSAFQVFKREMAAGRLSRLYDFQGDLDAAIELYGWSKRNGAPPASYFNQYGMNIGERPIGIDPMLEDPVSIRRAIFADLIHERLNSPQEMRRLWDQIASRVPDPNNPVVDMFGNSATAPDPIATISAILDAPGARTIKEKSVLGLDLRDLIARYRQDLYLDAVSGPHIGELTRGSRLDMASEVGPAGNLMSPSEAQALADHERTLDKSESHPLNPFHHKSTAGEFYGSSPILRELYDENVNAAEQILQSGGEFRPQTRFVLTPADLAAESQGGGSRVHIDRASVPVNVGIDGGVIGDAVDGSEDAIKHLEDQVDAHRKAIDGEGLDRTKQADSVDKYRAKKLHPVKLTVKGVDHRWMTAESKAAVEAAEAQFQEDRRLAQRIPGGDEENITRENAMTMAQRKYDAIVDPILKKSRRIKPDEMYGPKGENLLFPKEAQGSADDIDLHGNGFSFAMFRGLPDPFYRIRPAQWQFTSKVGRRMYNEVLGGHARAIDLGQAMQHTVARALQTEGRLSIFGKRPFKTHIAQGSAESQWISRHMDLRPAKLDAANARVEAAMRRESALASKLADLDSEVRQRGQAYSLFKTNVDAAKLAEAQDNLAEAEGALREASKSRAAAERNLEWLNAQLEDHQRQTAALSPEKVADLERRAKRIDTAIDLATHMRGRMEGSTAAFRTSPDVPLSTKLHRVLGAPGLDSEGRLIVEPDLAQWVQSGDNATPFMYPTGEAPGYRYDIVSTMRAFSPVVGRKVFLDPVLRKWQPTGGAPVEKTEARGIRSTLGGARNVSDIVAEANPHLIDEAGKLKMSPEEYAYFGEWMKHLQGYKPNGELAGDMVHLHNAKQLEQEAAKSGSDTEKASMLHAAKVLRWAASLEGGPMKASRAMEQAYIRGMLAFRQSTVVKNMFQNLSLVAEAHPMSILVGNAMFWADVSAGASSPIKTALHGGPLAQASNVNRQLEQFLSDSPHLVDQMAGRYGQSASKIRSNPARAIWDGFTAGVDHIGFAQLRGQEAMNRAWALHVGIADGLRRRGLSSIDQAMREGVFEELVREGIELSNRHHFVYGIMGRAPMVHANPVFRNLSLLTQYNQNEWDLVLQWVGAAKRENANVGAMFNMLMLTGYVTGLAARSGFDVTDWAGLWGVKVSGFDPEKPPYFLKSAPFEMLSGLIQMGAGYVRGDKAMSTRGQEQFIKNAVLPSLVLWDDVERFTRDRDAKRTGFYTDRRGRTGQMYDDTWRGEVMRRTGIRTIESAQYDRIADMTRRDRANQSVAFDSKSKRAVAEVVGRGYDKDYQKRLGLTPAEITAARDSLASMQRGLEAKGVTGDQFSRFASEAARHRGIPEGIWDALEGDLFDSAGNVKPRVQEAVRWLQKAKDPRLRELGSQYQRAITSTVSKAARRAR